MSSESAPHTVESPDHQPEPTFVPSRSEMGQRLEAAVSVYFEKLIGPVMILWMVIAAGLLQTYVPNESYLRGELGIFLVGLAPSLVFSIGVLFLYVVADAMHYEAAESEDEL